MHFQLLVAFSLGLVSILHQNAAEAQNVGDFIEFSTASLPGRLFIPPEAADPTAARPFILFLHGAGETGNNNVSQVGGNINNLLDAAKQRGAFLYAPQATSFNWSDTNRLTSVMTMIDQALAEQNADPSRVYVTGLSMGGGGTWNMLNRFSDRFAAGVPIAGVSPAGDFNSANLVDQPAWAFHARNDGVVSVNSSRTVVNNILAATGEPTPTYPPSNDANTTFEFVNASHRLNYTEWPTGGHGIWTRVYDTAEMYDWMFSLTAIPPQLGDTNGDGIVNIDDLNEVRNNFGRRGRRDGSLDGDAFPFNGLVTVDDLNAVRNHFGSGVTPVPEPSTVALALLSTLIVVVVRRRQFA